MFKRPSKTHGLRSKCLAFIRHRRGNVAIIASVVALPLTVALGMGVDYTFASYRQDQINGFADSATLSAVTPNMMATSSATQSQATASAMFMSQLATIPNINYGASSVTVTASDTTNAAVVTRTVHLSYTVASNNIFGGLLGMNSVTLSGISTATSSTAPNINFWMLLDDSPSMAIAATTTDINTMVANTPIQGGCAFACHETNPTADGLGNPPIKGYPLGGEDNYALARSLGVTLRIDLVNTATQNLLTTAASTAATYHTSYKFALYTMDYNLSAITGYSTPTTVSSSQISNLGISAITVFDNDCLTVTNCNNDTDSYLDQNMGTLGNKMPAPGNGTNSPTDTPQEVMFVVTDGVDDYYSGSTRVMAALGKNFTNCAAIKTAGIRIAFLYLTYNPLPTNSFYVSNIAPFQSTIATQAQNCASPGLYFEVNTGGDISGAMTTLFQRAVATAHLSQ